MAALAQEFDPQVCRQVVIITAVLAVLTLLANPMGPLGVFWRPSAHIPTPAGYQVPLFGLLFLAEGLTFGLGVSFLVYGYRLLSRLAPAPDGMTRAAHLSIFWLLINWWLHNSLHMHVGMDLNGLLAVDYGFHFTLMIAGAVLAAYFLRVMRDLKA